MRKEEKEKKEEESGWNHDHQSFVMKRKNIAGYSLLVWITSHTKNPSHPFLLFFPFLSTSVICSSSTRTSLLNVRNWSEQGIFLECNTQPYFDTLIHAFLLYSLLSLSLTNIYIPDLIFDLCCICSHENHFFFQHERNGNIEIEWIVTAIPPNQVLFVSFELNGLVNERFGSIHYSSSITYIHI